MRQWNFYCIHANVPLSFESDILLTYPIFHQLYEKVNCSHTIELLFSTSQFIIPHICYFSTGYSKANVELHINLFSKSCMIKTFMLISCPNDIYNVYDTGGQTSIR